MTTNRMHNLTGRQDRPTGYYQLSNPQPKEHCTNAESYGNERDFEPKEVRIRPHTDQKMPERLNAFQMLERIQKSLESLKCEHNALFCAIEPALVAGGLGRCEVEVNQKATNDPYSQLVNMLLGIESSIDDMARDVGSICVRVTL